MSRQATKSVLRSRIPVVGGALLTAFLLTGLLEVGGQTPLGPPQLKTQMSRIGGKPDLNGIWQAVNTANYDLEGQGGGPPPIPSLGAIGATPPGLSVVEGGRIPYQQWALAKRDENRKNRLALDPEVKCYLPGVPRATYLPYPFQIFQNQGDRILIVYQYSYARREIFMDKFVEAPTEGWMGWSNGKWEGDTLVVDVTSFAEPLAISPGGPTDHWLDRSGNFHTEALHVVERYTLLGPNHMLYEATIEDPKVFTRPWKISMPLYRRIEKNMQLFEFRCPEYTEQLLYGEFEKKP